MSEFACTILRKPSGKGFLIKGARYPCDFEYRGYSKLRNGLSKPWVCGPETSGPQRKWSVRGL